MSSFVQPPFSPVLPIAVDPTTGQVYTVSEHEGGEVGVFPNTGAEVENAPLEVFGSGDFHATPNAIRGIAVDPSKTVYVPNPGANDINIFTVGAITPKQTLTVSKTGTGEGTVTSTPAGINCRRRNARTHFRKAKK